MFAGQIMQINTVLDEPLLLICFVLAFFLGSSSLSSSDNILEFLLLNKANK